MTSGDLYKLLALRYPKEEYAFIPHVRNGTGWSKRVTREADAIAVSLWPSRGIEITGFEIKVDRGDWLREKKNPEKAEEIAQFCDRWFLVISDPAIAPVHEVPPNWGILCAKGNRLTMVRAAGLLKAAPMDKFFMAAIFRQASKFVVPQMSIDENMKATIEEEVIRRTNAFRAASERSREDLIEIQQRVRKFESISGVRIDRWDVEGVGKAVQMIQSAGSLEDRIKRERVELDAAVARAEASRETIQALTELRGAFAPEAVVAETEEGREA